MTFLTQLMAGNPADERYWQPVGWGRPSLSGIPISTESMLSVSVGWACIRLLSESVAMLPRITYRRLTDGRKERATNHPVYSVLHSQPNRRQTAYEFVDTMQSNALLRGNAYAKIVPGPRGPVDQLIPIAHHRVRVEVVSEDLVRYHVREQDHTTKVYLDDEIFHLKGFTLNYDDAVGVDPATYMRESLGLSHAAERYGSRFFGNGAQPGGVLVKKDGKGLSPDAAKRVKESWEESHSGGNQHRVAVLEEGLEWQSTTANNRDSQLLELREFQSEDLCRWWRVPPHMVGLTSKVTSWGSGIEELSLGFVTYTLMPWLERWSQLISKDLIIASETYFVEFLLDALMKGKLLDRYNAFQIGRSNGWLSKNDVRRFENMNPIPGGDSYETAAEAALPVPGSDEPEMTEPTAEDETSLKTKALGELVRAGFKQQDAAKAVGLPPMADWGLPPVTVQPRSVAEAPVPDETADKQVPNAPTKKDDDASAHYHQLAHEAASRVVRKETLALGRSVKRGDDWPAAVDAFYSDHAPFVAQTMRIAAEEAEVYVGIQRAALLEQGASALDKWDERAGLLVEMVVRGA